jgi:hypothetical protein
MKILVFAGLLQLASVEAQEGGHQDTGGGDVGVGSNDNALNPAASISPEPPSPESLASMTPAAIAAAGEEWVRSLGSGVLRSLSAQQLKALTPAQITALLPSQINQLKPEQISELPSELIGRLTGDQIAELTPVQVAALTSQQMPAISPSLMDRLAPETVQALSIEAVGALTEEQARALQPHQFTALSREKRAALPAVVQKEHRVRTDRFAIRPGIRFIGDAYSQLVESASAQGAFGGGVEVEAIAPHAIRTALLVRKGTQPSTLTEREDFGQALLNPQTESFFFGGEVAWWPQRAQIHRTMLGIQGHLHVAQTTWEVELAPADEEANLPERLFAVDTRVFSSAVAANVRYAASEGQNYVEVLTYLGVGLRWLSLDGDVDARLRELSAMDARIEDKTFLQQAIRDDRMRYWSVEMGAAIRVNSIVISASLPFIQGDIQGLSGWRFIPAISLRAGAQLVEFDGLEPATPSP